MTKKSKPTEIRSDQKPSGRHPVPGVSTSTTVFVGSFARGPLNEPLRVRNPEEFDYEFSGLDDAGEASLAVQQFFLNGGSDAWILRVAESGKALDAAAILGDPTQNSGLFGLERVDHFGILVIPEAANLPMREYRAVYGQAIRHCVLRRGFLLIDTPESVETPGQARQWLASHEDLRSSHSAVYFPRLRIEDPQREGSVLTVGPSGTVAGIYARIDAASGVWKAPAGDRAKLLGAFGFSCDLDDKDVDTLNPQAVNCLRMLPRMGPVAWGARTFAGRDGSTTEFKYVPARRLACFIEESIVRGTQWIVFEPTEEALWSRVRVNVAAFLQGLYERGAFQGSEPREAYFVKCDAETNSRADVEAGFVNLVVGFAPVIPSEFVTLPIRLVVGQTPGDPSSLP